MNEQELANFVNNTTTLSQEVKDNKLWIVVRGHVCDVSSFLDLHPGGEDILREYLGKDATFDFEQVVHSDSAIEQVVSLSVAKIPRQQKQEDNVAEEVAEDVTITSLISSIKSYFF